MIAPMNDERSPWWDVAIALVAAAAYVVPWAIDRRERQKTIRRVTKTDESEET